MTQEKSNMKLFTLRIDISQDSSLQEINRLVVKSCLMVTNNNVELVKKLLKIDDNQMVKYMEEENESKT